jgi:hypothetical protein
MFSRVYRSVLVVLFLTLLLIGLLWVVNIQPISSTPDCELIRRLGPSLWSSSMDNIVHEGTSINELRSKSGSCGYTFKYWSTATPAATPTFSPGCQNEVVMYNASGGEPVRARTAVARIRECVAAFTPTP